MKIVMKKNKQLKIPDEKLEEFLEMGYSRIDENGEVITAGKATTLAGYEAENNSLKAENVELKKEIENLKAENAKLKENNSGKDKDQEKKSKSKA